MWKKHLKRKGNRESENKTALDKLKKQTNKKQMALVNDTCQVLHRGPNKPPCNLTSPKEGTQPCCGVGGRGGKLPSFNCLKCMSFTKILITVDTIEATHLHAAQRLPSYRNKIKGLISWCSSHSNTLLQQYYWICRHSEKLFLAHFCPQFNYKPAFWGKISGLLIDLPLHVVYNRFFAFLHILSRGYDVSVV